MPRVNAIQTNFSAGELSPLLFARVDLDKYPNGCFALENFVTQRYGGVRKRGGSQYIAPVKTHSARVRLAAFIYSVTQAYVLEFGNSYVRFYTNGGRVESPPGTPVEVVTPWDQNQIWDLQFAQSADVLYITHPLYPPHTLSRTSATTFVLEEMVFEDGPYLELNTTATTLAPASTGTLASASFTSVGNATGIENIGGSGVSNAYWIKCGTPAQAPTEWNIEGFDGSVWVPLDSQGSQTGWAHGSKRFFSFTNKASYSNYRIIWFGNNGDPDSNFTITLNQSGDTMTPFDLNASATTGINGGLGFLASDVGRLIQLLGGDNRWRWARIITRTSGTVVTIRIYGQALPDTRPILNWAIGAWSNNTGWPACVGFYQGRLCFARTDLQPQTVWMSQVDDFVNFGTSTPLVDSDAINATISSESVNEIKWVAEGTNFFLGTTAAIRTLGPNSPTGVFSPTNLLQKRETNYGASALQPVRIGNTVIYSGYYRRDVREIAYSFEQDGYTSQDLSLLSEHIVRLGIKQAAFAQNPDGVVWMVTEDNKLAGMTYERDQNVIAFHRHILGGSLSGGETAVESVTTIPGADRDETWIVARRTINGTAVRYVERLSHGLLPEEDKEDATFLDSYLVYDGPAATTISNLGHLAGQTVKVWGDGAYRGEFTVSGSSIVLPASVGKATIGLSYTGVIETLSPEMGARGGTAQTVIGSIPGVFLRVNRSLGGKIGGATARTLEDINFRTMSDLMDTSAPLYTGDKEVNIEVPWETGKRLRLEHSDPVPFNLLGLIYKLTVNG